MLGVNKRREVKTLLREHKPSAVARRTGVSLSSVKRIARESDVGHVDDATERRRRRIGRPSKIRCFRSATTEGIAECTPNFLASYEQVETTPRRPRWPMISGFPTNAGSSRTSTAA